MTDQELSTLRSLEFNEPVGISNRLIKHGNENFNKPTQIQKENVNDNSIHNEQTREITQSTIQTEDVDGALTAKEDALTRTSSFCKKAVRMPIKIIGKPFKIVIALSTALVIFTVVTLGTVILIIKTDSTLATLSVKDRMYLNLSDNVVDDKKDKDKHMVAPTIDIGKPNDDTTKNPKPNKTGSKADGLIGYAKQFLGCPYVWGAKGAMCSEAVLQKAITDGGFTVAFQRQFIGKCRAFDCSGFVTCVYKEYANIDVGDGTFSQVEHGTAVSKSNLKPGDLVFFGSSTSPHHVGIYVGNDEYIHAPKTGDVVKISKLSDRGDFSAARHISDNIK